MIPDAIFKKLQHSFAGFQPYLNGQAIEPGYKPDFVLKKNDEYIILESENSSSRKTYVGGMIKAAHFLTNEKKGKLVFIIVPKKNTKSETIAKHLQKYLVWLSDKTNLKDVYVIDANTYLTDRALLALDCDDFYAKSFKV